MNPDEAISGFLAKYTPEVAAQVIEARRHLAAHFPRGFELVYDNYNALVFAFATSQRVSDAVLSIAAYPKWITLFFAHGTKLSDPNCLLEGSGTQFRSIRLAPSARLHEQGVQELIRRAKALVHQEFAAAPALTTVIKSVSAKQRARKPASAGATARKAAPKRRPSGA